MSTTDYNVSPSENKSSSSLPSSLSPNEDNSLADFRSPKLEVIPRLVFNNFKSTFKKTKKKSGLSKSKTACKDGVPSTSKQTGNAKVDSSQPSIESSFFKPATNVKTAYLCPLCFKPHKDETAQAMHMKSCATKNKVSTRKLLAAMQLQERQAEERRAMGLLTAPVVQPKRSISRKTISDNDPQLQMGLALSMSMQEMQQKEELEVAMLLAGESNESIPEFTTEDYRKTLQCFGFTTNKPIVAHSVKESKKKKHLQPTILQTRSREERDRILAERITEVLIGNEAITQKLQQQMDNVVECKEHVVLKSSLLEKFHCTENRLWDKTKLTSSCQDFYVEALSPLISSVKRQQHGSDTAEQSSPTMSKSSDKYEDITTMKDCENMPITLDENINMNVKPIQCCHVKSVYDTKKTNKFERDKRSSNALALDWVNTLNTSSMSDVVVFVKGEHHIWTHALVFFVRCSNIMLDIIPNNSTKFPNIKQMICWPETDYCTALAFLEFIYCSVIEKYSYVFDDSKALIQIKVLAKKYRVKDLFVYLIKRRAEENTCNFCGDLQNDRPVNAQRIEKHDECDEQENKVSVVHDAPKCQMVHSQSSKKQAESSLEENEIKCTTLKYQVAEESYADTNTQTNRKAIRKSVENAITSAKISSDKRSCNSAPNSPMKINVFTPVTIEKEKTDNVETLEKNQLQINTFKFREGSVSPDIFDDIEEEIVHYTQERSIENEKNSENTNERSKENCNTSLKVINQDSQFNIQNNVNLSIPADTNTEALSDIIIEKDDSTDRDNFNLKYENVTIRRKTTAPSSSAICSEENLKMSLKSNSWEQQIIDTDTTKQKSNLSLLIEKMQRQNAKSVSDSDSDSETESPLKFPMKHYRNPFNVMQDDESYLLYENCTKENSHLETLEKKRNALSLFEEDIMKERAKNPKAFNLTSFKGIEDVDRKKNCDRVNFLTSTVSCRSQEKSVSSNSSTVSEDLLQANAADDDVFYLTQTLSGNIDNDKNEIDANTSGDDKNESMYTRYKRKHNRNSIDKYRTALKNCLWHNVKSDDILLNDESLDTCTGTASKSINLNEGKSICSKDHTSNDNSYSNDKNIELSDLKIDTSNSFTVVLSDGKDEAKMKNSKYLKDELKENENNSNTSSNEPFTAITRDNLIELKNNKKNVIDPNLSDIETDVNYYIESVSYSKRSKRLIRKGNRNYSINTVIPDIHEAETDVEEKSPTLGKKIEKNVSTSIKKKLFQSKNSRETIKWGKRSSLDLESTRKVDSVAKLNYRNHNSDEYESDSTCSYVNVNLKKLSNVSDEVKNLLQECKSTANYRFSDNNETRDPSPILISSSPEIPTNDFSARNFKDDNNTRQGIVELNDCNEIENLHGNDVDIKTTDTNDTFDKLIYTSEKIKLQSTWNSSCSSEARKEKTMEFTNESVEKKAIDHVDVSYKIVQTNRTSPNSPCSKFKKVKLYDKSEDVSILNDDTLDNTEKYTDELKDTSTPRNLRHGSISPEKRSKRIRTFKAKSVSEGNFGANSKQEVNELEVLFDRSTPWVNSTPTRDRFRNNNDQITPPADYSAMKTPQLRQELQKYGLKAQKRNRAKQLLRYIYSELHPLSPTINENTHPNAQTSSSSEDEKPPSKKIKIVKTRKEKQNIAEDKEECDALEEKMSNDSDGSVIVEKIELDKPDTVGQVHNCTNVKETFWKLIKSNKELHNKVLTYDPLNLELLHATLKTEGFKCKLDTLRDFLDEECITFRQQAQFNKNKTKRKINFKANDK